MKYLLPCSCGKSVAVEPAQAGQSVRCACGRMLEVPAMRLVRQLTPAARDAAGARRAAPSWPRAQRMLFAAGLALLVGGAATAGYYQWVRMQLQTEEVPWDDVQGACATIERMNISDAWEVWTVMRDVDIGPYAPPIFVHHRRIAVELLRYVIMGSAAAGVGLVLMLLAVAVRPAAGSTPRRPATRA
jgi:hypothetical protein